MMKGMTKYWRSVMLTVATLVALALLAAPPARADGDDDSPVFSPNSKPYGLSYGEWSARLWQWTFSLPVDAHPLFDTADCSAGQSGEVWFLGGTFSALEISPGVILGEATRKCTIPQGKALFFPLVDVECSTIEGNGTTEAELRDCAKFFGDFLVPESLSLTIDGKAVKKLDKFRVQSPLFTFGPLPDNNVLQFFGLDAPAGSTSPSVSDGVFAMLKPLSKGKHTIHFTGSLDIRPIGGPLFIQDITYKIHVR